MLQACLQVCKQNGEKALWKNAESGEQENEQAKYKKTSWQENIKWANKLQEWLQIRKQ